MGSFNLNDDDTFLGDNLDDDDIELDLIPECDLLNFFQLSPVQESYNENSNEDEFLWYDMSLSKEVSYLDDLNNIQDEFINFMKIHEMEHFQESYVEKYFSFYDSPLNDIIMRSRTQLWLDNCIYGLHFQAYICMRWDIPLPMVPQRNRKCPILHKNASTKKKGIMNDHILEYLYSNSKRHTDINNIRQRDAPRNQIGLLIFLLDMLNHPYYKMCVKWDNKRLLTFTVLNSKLVAYYWSIVKENDTCNFENFARAIRYLRNDGYFKQTDKKRQKSYQFNRKAIKEYRNKRIVNALSETLFHNLEEFPN